MLKHRLLETEEKDTKGRMREKWGKVFLVLFVALWSEGCMSVNQLGFQNRSARWYGWLLIITSQRRTQTKKEKKKKRKNRFPHTATWSAYTPFFLSSPYPFGSFLSTPPLFCALPCFCTLAWKLEGNLEGKRGVSPRVSPVELESVFSLQERKSANWPHNCNFGYLPRGQQAHVTSDSASAVAEVRPG